MKNENKTKKLTTIASLVALSMVLSYLESLIPPLVAVPGVKIGLANIITVFSLYLLDAKSAILISLLRVCLSSLLFGNTVSFIYSLSGALLSYLVMLLLLRLDFFSEIGVSVSGGVAHNVGQVAAAAVVMQNSGLLYYIAPLLISGSLAGVAVGIIAALAIRRLRGKINK